MQQKEEFLSESHRIKEKVREKALDIIAVFLLGLVGYLIIGYFLRDQLISKEDKRALALIEQYRVMSQDKGYLQRLEEAERQIKSRYPIVITPLQAYSLLKSPASKTYKTLGLMYVFFPLLASIGLGLYLKRVYDRAGKEIFYQTHSLEKELYRKEPDYPYFTDTGIVDWNKFVDVRKVLELYAYVGNLKPEEYERLKNTVYLAKDLALIYAFHTLPKTSQNEKFQAIIYFLLWHYGLCLFGNVPVGYLSRFIKDEDLKTALAIYQRRRVNISGEDLARKVLMVLACCDRDNGLYDIFAEIDPLKSPSSP